MKKEVKLGFIGAGRSDAYISGARACEGARIVAVCDRNLKKLEYVKKLCSEETVFYTDFESFLEHDMDAVVVCNYFNEHTPYAIKCMEKGFHVLSETIANSTLGEGVELCRAVEKYGKIYMLAENYPFMCSNLELKRLYEEGTLGKVIYAEGEYVHPGTLRDRIMGAPGLYHWRAWAPSTYYCTHAMAPLMHMTGAIPKVISAQSAYINSCASDNSHRQNVDRAGIILCKMDNGAVFRVMGCGNFAVEGNWYRLAGEHGAAETVRGCQNDILLRYNHWNVPEGKKDYQRYTAQWPAHGDLAEKAGHGGGDFWVMYHFIKAIQDGTQPFFDVYKAVAVSSVGILAWKSALENGKPYVMPDWSKEEERKQYENDYWTPFPNRKGWPLMPANIGGYAASEEGIANAKAMWEAEGIPKEVLYQW